MPVLTSCLIAATLATQPPRDRPRPNRANRDSAAAAVNTMPLSGLTPSKYVEGLCVYTYPVSTRSPECQKFCDQALGYYYSYVWIESARSFETALKHDPECAFAWLGLSRAFDKWGRSQTPNSDPFFALAGASWKGRLPDYYNKSPKDFALEQARRLMPKANHREQLLIQAKLQERGMWPDVKPDERKKKAQQTLDELLTMYDDDEEAWFARAQIAEGPNSATPFYKALLRVNPLHPGANHELVHSFENIRRPALGWPFAEKYIESSPKIPHAFHMQAHLATRIGKWDHTSDWSAKAIRLEKEYHTLQGVKHSEDHQFNHHMETLTRSLIHDGRFAEAEAIKKDAEGYGYKFRPEWFRMALSRQDWEFAEKLVAEFRKQDKATGAYYAALVALERGLTDRARAEVDVLQQNARTKKDNRQAQQRLNEVLGRLECQTGNGEAGVKLIRRIIDKTKDDYNHHAWGNGAVYMEMWGIAALEAGITAEAEEAFQEALAHDAGSVRGALGMWALCDRLGRIDEAARYLKVALRCWAKADPADFERLKNSLRAKADRLPTTATLTTTKSEPGGRE